MEGFQAGIDIAELLSLPADRVVVLARADRQYRFIAQRCDPRGRVGELPGPPARAAAGAVRDNSMRQVLEPLLPVAAENRPEAIERQVGAKEVSSLDDTGLQVEQPVEVEKNPSEADLIGSEVTRSAAVEHEKVKRPRRRRANAV
jgi:hypothetical protein